MILHGPSWYGLNNNIIIKLGYLDIDIKYQYVIIFYSKAKILTKYIIHNYYR